MPTWTHHLDLADLYTQFRDAHGASFEHTRDEIVTRLRTAEFYTKADEFYKEGAIVLRGLVDDIATAATVPDFNRHFHYLYMWADQDHVRVWINT